MRVLACRIAATFLIVLIPGAMGGEAVPPAKPAEVAQPPASVGSSQAARNAPQAASLGFEWASVFEPGAQVAPGDYTRTIRPFQTWTQICDAVKGGRRLCYLETIARQGGTMASWRIALTKDGRSMALIILPPDSDGTDGITVGFSGMTRTIKPLVCDKMVCVATFPVDGPIVGLLVQDTNAQLTFKRAGQSVALTASLSGMSKALVDLTPGAPAQQRPAKPRATAAHAAQKPSAASTPASPGETAK